MSLTALNAAEAALRDALASETIDRDAAAAAGVAYGQAQEKLTERRYSIYVLDLYNPIFISGVGFLSSIYAEHVGHEDYRINSGDQVPFSLIKNCSKQSYQELPQAVRDGFDI